MFKAQLQHPLWEEYNIYSTVKIFWVSFQWEKVLKLFHSPKKMEKKISFLLSLNKFYKNTYVCLYQVIC